MTWGVNMVSMRRMERAIYKNRDQMTYRAPPELFVRLDKHAKLLGLSRNQLMTKLLRVSLDSMDLGEAAGEKISPSLFAEFGDLVAKGVEDGIREAMRHGGIELALHRSDEVRKQARRLKAR